jgi:hypothetical protein
VHCSHCAQHRLSGDDFQYSRGTNGSCVEEYEKVMVITYTLKDSFIHLFPQIPYTGMHPMDIGIVNIVALQYMKPHLKQKQEIHLKASNRDIIQKYRV